LKIYRELGDKTGTARTSILEANALLANGRAEDAIATANYALGNIGPQEARFELLARGIIIESLVILGRPAEALQLFSRAQPIFEQAPDLGSRLRVKYLRARLLEGIDRTREAEKIYKGLIDTYMDSELYKEAFITFLSLFDLHIRRGAFGKAANVCKRAIEAWSQIERGGNEQIPRAWERLWELVRLRQINEGDLFRAKEHILRHWSVSPAEGIPQALPQALRLPSSGKTEVSATPDTLSTPPPIPAALDHDRYRAAREGFDRDLVETALREAGGNISEASRRLGVTRNTFKSKLRRYGL
jgi:tetratricopeptide (TPR) repeat protein